MSRRAEQESRATRDETWILAKRQETHMGLMGIIYNCRLLPEFQSLLQAVKSWALLVLFLDHFASHFFSLALDVKASFGKFL